LFTSVNFTFIALYKKKIILPISNVLKSNWYQVFVGRFFVGGLRGSFFNYEKRTVLKICLN
ncbi:hypothetical protein COY07_00355, partial [Candidatus Peregrinibacteria bacterium CG_4_10_14_0_2_um_filter_43_11]